MVPADDDRSGTASPATDDDAPLLVLLHGHGDEPAEFLPIGHEVAPDGSWRILCPPGPHRLESGGRAWWADDDEAPAPATIEQLVSLVAGATGDVCIAGFSQGGAAALAVARAAGRLTRPPGVTGAVAVAVVAGFLDGEGSVPSDLDVLVVHGTADGVVDPFHGELVARRCRRHGCDVTEVTHDGGHVWDEAVTAAVRNWLRR